MSSSDGRDVERQDGGEAPREPAGAERLVDRQDSPDKRHGDALRDGSGSRQGEPSRGVERDGAK